MDDATDVVWDGDGKENLEPSVSARLVIFAVVATDRHTRSHAATVAHARTNRCADSTEHCTPALTAAPLPVPVLEPVLVGEDGDAEDAAACAGETTRSANDNRAALGAAESSRRR